MKKSFLGKLTKIWNLTLSPTKKFLIDCWFSCGELCIPYFSVSSTPLITSECHLLSLKALNRPMKWNERQPAAVKRLAFPALLQHWGYCMREGKKKQEVEQWFFFLSSFLEWAKCLGTSRSLNLVGKKFKRESKMCISLISRQKFGYTRFKMQLNELRQESSVYLN